MAKKTISQAYLPNTKIDPSLKELLERLFSDPSYLPLHGPQHLKEGNDPTTVSPQTITMQSSNTWDTKGRHAHQLDFQGLANALQGQIIPGGHGDNHTQTGVDPVSGYVPGGTDPTDTGVGNVGIGTSGGPTLNPSFLLTTSKANLGAKWMNTDTGAFGTIQLVDGKKAFGLLGPVATDITQLNTSVDPDTGLARPYNRIRMWVDKTKSAYLESDGTTDTLLPITFRVNGNDAVIASDKFMSLPAVTEHPTAEEARDGSIWQKDDEKLLYAMEDGKPYPIIIKGGVEWTLFIMDSMIVTDQTTYNLPWTDGPFPMNDVELIWQSHTLEWGRDYTVDVDGMITLTTLIYPLPGESLYARYQSKIGRDR